MTDHQNNSYVIGVDFGTGSCKTVILDCFGRILGTGSGDYPSDNLQSQWQEQNPDSLITGMLQSVREAMGQSKVPPDACLGLSVGGALHSLMALDKNNRALTGIMTWADGRAVKQVNELRDHFDMHSHYLHTGCPNHPMYPLSKIVWLREEKPSDFKKATWFISAKEYVVYKLTGEHIVDYNVASASGLLDTRNLVWDEMALDMAGINPAQLSSLSDPREVIGYLAPKIAEEMGLSPGTPVVLGCGDAVNSSLGTGAVHSNQITCMIGTSGAIRVFSNQALFDPKERTWCYAIDPSHWLVGGAINNGGLALWWLQHAFSQGSQTGLVQHKLDLAEIMQWSEQIEPGSEGVICLPFFTNERSPNWNPNARAVFFGLTIDHDQRHMARAVLEGVGYRLRSVLDALDEVIGTTGEVRASGGFIQSNLWIQVIADILNRKVLIPETKETSAIGAAFWALLGAGVVDKIESLDPYIKILTSYQPQKENNQVYEKQYHVYKALYESVRGLFNGV